MTRPGPLDPGQRLAPAQIRPRAGLYLVRVPHGTRPRPVRLDAEGRLLSAESLPRRIEFLDRRG